VASDLSKLSMMMNNGWHLSATATPDIYLHVPQRHNTPAANGPWQQVSWFSIQKNVVQQLAHYPDNKQKNNTRPLQTHSHPDAQCSHCNSKM
jgi:hypothetical protein